MTPDAIDRFIKVNAYKMDGPAQWLGSEPNVRERAERPVQELGRGVAAGAHGRVLAL
jgi:hypothetical protein